MRVVIFLQLLAVAFAAVPQRMPSRMSSRIAGGTPTTIEQYPFMAIIQHLYPIEWLYWCGGTLLTTRTVLSAAQCLDHPDLPYLYRVRLGTSYLSSDGTVHEVSRIIHHEDYDHYSFNFQNDVAIAHLTTPAILSETVATARIVAPNFNLPDGTQVTAIGWGLLGYNPEEDIMVNPEQLHHVDINIINHELCIERYAYLNIDPVLDPWPKVTDGMVCFGILDVGGKGTCHGDVGGPILVNEDIVYAISSWGYETCAHKTYPGVGTRVSYYSDWIVANGSV